MTEDSFSSIKSLLMSTKPEELRQGLVLVKSQIAQMSSDEAKPLFEMVSAIFYIDPLDHPELVPILDEAATLVAGFGEWVIPVLLGNLDAGDLKAQVAIAHALGRIGANAIKPLMAVYETSEAPTRRTFVLYALGKIKLPEIVQAAHLALEAAQSPDRELRDTATRVIGKFAESVPPSHLSEDLRREFVEKLQINLADPSPGIRAKAVRSLGKLARYGHLNATEREKLKTLCRLLLGIDGNFDWDRAYIVRKEAEEALKYI